MKLSEIKLATPDAAEESIGWYMVRERDDRIGAGPYKSYREAVSESKHKEWFKTTGSNPFYIEHGYVNDVDTFVQMDEDK